MRVRLPLLLLILAPLAGCELMQSVDRGLYDATEMVTERDRVTGRRSISMADREQQIGEGNQAVQQFMDEAKSSGIRLNEAYSPQAYQRIQRIFKQLHKVSHLSHEQWAPVLVEKDEWNAFTTGGTYIVIYSGLEKDLEDDSELANVIAHEMAHVVANHGFEQRSYLMLNALGGSKSAGRETFSAAFTHENESEADRLAVLYAALAGFDPYAGGRIWERMHRQSGNDALMIHDHPMNAERAANARDVANAVAQYYKPGELNPDYKKVLADNEVFSSSPILAPVGEGGGVLAVMDTVFTAMQQKQQVKSEEQRQKKRIKFMQSIHGASKIISSQAVGVHRWRFTVRYQGDKPLTNVSFKAFIRRAGESKPLMVTRHHEGVLRPNTTFVVDFASESLDAYNTISDNVRFRYDDARLL